MHPIKLTTHNSQPTTTFLVLALILFSIASGQKSVKFIYFNNATYDYLDYQINSGIFSPSFAFHQPYQLDSNFAFPNTRVGNYFSSYWQNYYGDGKLSLQLQGNIDLKQDESIKTRFGALGSVHWSAPYITVANRTAVDENFKYDPNFAGDLSESSSWIYGRVMDAYIQLNFAGFEAFYGRINRNWGPIGEKSLTISNVPYSFDHFLFSYTTKYFKLSLMTAQLDNMDALEKLGADKPEEIILDANRYLVAHRLDIPISDKLQLAFTETATYGGEKRQWEWEFLNPMQFYYSIQRNDGKQMNGRWAMDIFWKPWKQWTFYTQFLLDDIIVNNDPGVDDRGQYPDRLGIYLSARNADSFIPGLNTNISYTKIWNRTYQGNRTYENYQYRGLSLGYPCASCEEVKINIGYWGLFPFYFKNEMTIGQYGDVEVTDLFPSVKEDFPVKPITKNFINNLTFNYFFSETIQFSARATYREVVNHYSNQFSEKDHWVFSITAKAIISGGWVH